MTGVTDEVAEIKGVVNSLFLVCTVRRRRRRSGGRHGSIRQSPSMGSIVCSGRQGSAVFMGAGDDVIRLRARADVVVKLSSKATSVFLQPVICDPTSSRSCYSAQALRGTHSRYVTYTPQYAIHMTLFIKTRD